MKEAMTKVIDTLTQEDFHGALQKLLERYRKCIAAEGDYFEGDASFVKKSHITIVFSIKFNFIIYSELLIVCNGEYRSLEKQIYVIKRSSSGNVKENCDFILF